MMRRGLAAVTLLASLACPPEVTGQGRPAANEAQLKAAFIVGFMRFAQWAPSAAPGPQSPYLVCIMDDVPVLEAFATTAKVTVQSRPVRVRSVAKPDDISGCHVLYLGQAVADPRVATRALERKNILTVADVGADVGAIIRFLLAGDRLAFEVDLGTARSAGLEIGSQLLGVAHRVVGKPSGKP